MLWLLLTLQTLTVWKPAELASLKPEVLGAPTIADGALQFDGLHDGLIVPMNPIAGWDKFTIEVLFLPQPDGSPAQRFIHLADEQGRRVLLETRSPDGATWCLDTFLRGEKDECTLRDMTRLHPTGEWAWVALVYDGRTMSHYVNGLKELGAEFNFEPMTSGRTSLGVRLDRQYWFKGAIKEIRFYPTPLPPEALQHY